MLAHLKKLIGRLHLVDFIYANLVLPRKVLPLPDYPVFKSKDASDHFYKLLERCDFYVEYGAGGSTIAAASLQKKFKSYESSNKFAERIRGEIKRRGYSPNCADNVIDKNFGPTRSWSIPFPYLVNKLLYMRKMKQYSDAHWSTEKREPDLILIDGRFRVSCALKNLLMLQEEEFDLVIDDYAERPEYHIIEHYAKLVHVIGTTAFFRGKKNLSDITAVIEKYELDYR